MAIAQRFGIPRSFSRRSGSSSLTKIMPLIAKKSVISMFSPIRITKLLEPVTVHSAACPSKCRNSALMISFAQSISQKVIPGEHRAPVAPLDLDGVDVDDERQQRDGRPLQVPGRAKQALGFQREGGRGGHRESSS